MDLKDATLARVSDVGNQVQGVLQPIESFISTNENIIFIVGWSAFVGVITYAALSLVNRRKPQDEIAELKVEEMKKRAILDQKYADAFGDKLFDMLMADEIDRHEYKRACRRFGLAYGLTDLLVRKNKKRGMKYRVRHNCEVIRHTTPSMVGKALGPHPSTDLPATVVVTKRKVWVVAGKALLRRKPAN